MAEPQTPPQPQKPVVLGFDDLKGVPPTFFLGMGGSGGRVVDVLAKRLKAEPTWARFQKLIHFICVDTDANDLSRLARRVETSNISIAGKRRRMQLLRGEMDHEANERLTSWVHPWYGFRDEAGKGAGQIRLESRFSLHCQIQDALPGNIRDIIVRKLREAMDALNPNQQRGANVRFFIYGSLAGGTGSGASLQMAYLVRKLAEDAGVPAEVYGMFFLPSVFRDRVESALVSKINANGYAALKEIEWCQEMRYDKAGPDKLEFVYDPRRTAATKVSKQDSVERAAFDWVYVVDKPEKLAIDQIYQAAGESAYLQLFSPILAFQDREGDNFAQLQSEPSDGYFAVQYGSMGSSVLELPRERLVRYFARKKTVELVERLVVGKPPSHSGIADDLVLSGREFLDLAESEQNRRIDEAFKRFVEYESRQEKEAEKKGLFTDIAELRVGQTNLLDEFRARLNGDIEALKSEVVIATINAPAITPENPTLNHARVNLGRDYKAGKQTVDKKAQLLAREIASGQYLSKFFRDFKASPLQQRFFLVRVNELSKNQDLRTGVEEEDATLLDWCFLPSADIDSVAYLARKPPEPIEYDVDLPEVRKRIANAEERLQTAAKKLVGKEKAFDEARIASVREFQRLEQAAGDALIIDFWHQINRSLRQHVEKRADLFRVIAKKGLSAVDHLRAQAENVRERGGVIPDIGKTDEDAAEFHLGNEVFHDARNHVRQWHILYRLMVEQDFVVDTGEVLGRVNEVLDQAAAANNASGPATNSSDDVLNGIIDRIDKAMRDKMQRFLDVDKAIDLFTGLETEAKITLLGNRLDITPQDMERVDPLALEPYIADKLSFVASMSVPLARFDEAVLAGAGKRPYRPRFYGIDHKLLDKSPLVAKALKNAATGFSMLEDWNSHDILTFYQATLGVPLYAWRDVQDDLGTAYEYEVKDSGRGHPLHIDSRWESKGFHGNDSLGIPGLSLGARRKWEAERKAWLEEQARKKKAEEDAQLRAASASAGQLARALAAGFITESFGAWSLNYRGRAFELGGGLAEALQKFAALPDAVRGPVDRAAQEALQADPGKIAELRNRLDDWLFDAGSDGRTADEKTIGLLQAQLK